MGADIVGATIRTKPAARPGDLEMVVEAVTAGVPETLPDMAGTYIVGRTAEGKRMVIDEGLAGFIIDIIGPAPAPDFNPAGPRRGPGNGRGEWWAKVCNGGEITGGRGTIKKKNKK